MLKQVMIKPKEIIFEEIEKPVIKDGEVLLKMMKIGVCGSDIHVNHGMHPFTSYPVTQGHEVSGEVCESKSSLFSVGDKVTVQPQVVCGECHPCRNGKYNLCEELKVMGFQTTGLAAEYVAIQEKYVTKLPDTMTFEQGAMIEPLAVAVHAINRFGDVKDKKVTVMGAGPIGIMVAQVAKAFGAEVLITDISDVRLEIAKECKIDYAINTRNTSFNDALINSFGKDKADVIYDCAGNDITMNDAINFARKGSTIILVAVFDKKANIDLAILNDHELDLNTSMMYRNEDYLKAIELVNSGKVVLDSLVTARFKFTDYEKAYKFIDDNREKTMKVIIDVCEK